MEIQHEMQFQTCQKAGILLVFFIGFGFYIDGSSSSREVARCELESGFNNLIFSSKKYITESYFEKCKSFVESNFKDFIADELLSHSCKWLPDNLHALLRLSVPNHLLIGEGSHRHLYSIFRIHSQSELISHLPSYFCKAIIIERLPFGVFADPFELQHLLQRGVFTDIAVFGDTNLELPSVASNQSVVEIHMNVSLNIFLGQTTELEISIDLPLHARYPPLGESGYAKVEFGRPDLLICCRREGNLSNQSCLFSPIIDHVKSKTDAVEWRIPSGTRSHADIVSVVTFVTASISTLVIVITTLFYSDISLCKNN